MRREREEGRERESLIEMEDVEEIEKQTERYTDRQTDRKTDRQTDRKTDRQTDIGRERKRSELRFSYNDIRRGKCEIEILRERAGLREKKSKR